MDLYALTFQRQDITKRVIVLTRCLFFRVIL